MKLKKNMFIQVTTFIKSLLIFILLFGYAIAQNQDCISSTIVCNNGRLSGNSNGIGSVNEYNTFNTGCLIGGEHQSTWWKFYVNTNGVLNFTIDPLNNVDYDFALYQGNSCSVLDVNNTSPLRCSYAAPEYDCNCYWYWFFGWYYLCETCYQYNTGLNSSETSQNSEDEYGGGNYHGFTNTLSVTAGQTYFLLVDNWTADYTGFNLDFTGTTADISCTPLPIENYTFKIDFYNDKYVKLKWEFEYQYNVEKYIIEKEINKNFIEIGSVVDSGLNYYQYKDFNLLNGVNKYRLKVKDFDGSIQYTNIVEADIIIENKDIKLYVDGNHYLYFLNLENDSNYNIYNTAGYLIGSGNYEKDDNIYVGDFCSGWYIVELKNEKQRNRYKFIKY